MVNRNDYIELVKQAQLGDEKSVNRLAELGRRRLGAYIYRLTLDEDLTQDIIQESMLEMLKFLNKLERAERFWPWLFRIAGNNLHDHWDHERLQKTKLKSKRPYADSADKQQGLENMVSQELKQVVSAAMTALRPRHRKVLILRCYEEMSYSEISEVMACSEFAARRLFHRAKNSLAKQLSRRGLGRGSLLMALVLFGKMTAASEAAAASVSVTGAVIKVGTVAALGSLVTSKTSVVSLAIVGVLAVGTVVTTLLPDKASVGNNHGPAASVLAASPSAQAAGDSEEFWYYFPEGPGRPMMMRVKLGAGEGRHNSQFLQNDQSNYHYHNNAICINNNRMFLGDLSVLRLPTDSPELAGFISRVEGREEQAEYVPNREKGLLVITTRNSPQGPDRSLVTRHSNVLDERYFLPDWPAEAKVIDNRDAMHKRGWTYFRIAGHINGQEVSGAGRIPFVYAASKRFSPWLKLQLAGGSKIVDSGAGACVYNKSGEVAARYKGGSFFKGLSRPWMGLHTIDIVRRDAAEQEVWFETKSVPDSRQVEVVLSCKQVKLVYTIDMETDVVEKITFAGTDGSEGELRFSYLQDIESTGDEFASPRAASSRRSQQSSGGMLWLVKLFNNRW
jgi:RNA polymerase sigma-70 factor (ECF subfamily)